MKRGTRIVAWVAGVVLLITSVKFASLTAYNWWAAGFRDNPNSPTYQSAGDWYFAGAIASLVAALALLVGSVYMTVRGKARHRQDVKESPPLPS